MADDITVEVKGLAELQTALEELPEKIAQKGLRSSLKAGGAPIKDGMVSLAPKDSGFLAEHFGVRVKISRDGISGSAFIGPQGKIDYPAYASGIGTYLLSTGSAVNPTFTSTGAHSTSPLMSSIAAFAHA